jgi:hypothetical protein
MNILVVVTICALAVGLLWVAQSCALLVVGEPLALPLRFTTRRPLVRWTARVMVQVTWLLLLVGVPLALGVGPAEALNRAFPLPVPWRKIATGSLILVLPFVTALLAETWIGWIRIEPKFDAATLRGKLFRRVLTPVPLATMEEGVFRGIILEQLLETMPSGLGYRTTAIIISALLFSSVHFIRPQPIGKPVWLQAYGFFLAGCIFGVAYVVSGRNLWVSIALHAWAILIIEIERLYCHFVGPRWLIGFAESPYSGVLGTAGAAGMALALLWLI